MKLIIDIDDVFYEGCKKGRILDTTVDRLIDSIANGVPTEEVTPIIQGKWIRCDDSTSNQKCNICGNYKVNQLETNYCGKCGAKMKESEEEE